TQSSPPKARKPCGITSRADKVWEQVWELRTPETQKPRITGLCVYGLAVGVRFELTDFLSCLYGSEQVSVRGFPELMFLSCLYGSERRTRPRASSRAFLSCLYGSEHHVFPRDCGFHGHLATHSMSI